MLAVKDKEEISGKGIKIKKGDSGILLKIYKKPINKSRFRCNFWLAVF